MNQERKYIDLMKKILSDGEKREDRTGTGTLSIFGPQIEFDISEEFPLLTTKKVNFGAVAHELLWFLSGNTNINYLNENNIHIWDEWADEDGDLGKIYGHQWRNYGSENVDQITNVVNDIKNNPNSRRLIVTSWNPVDIPHSCLPPCHMIFQFYVRNNKYLDCKMYQRSADFFLGVPFNIASYSLLTYIIASVCSLKPGNFIHTFGDAHLYLNHIDQAKLQISRGIRQFPELYINLEKKNIFDFDINDFKILNYDPHSYIKAPISV